MILHICYTLCMATAIKNVPYYGNPGNACALACYTMIAQYLLPNAAITFEQLGRIGDWHKDYVIWEFPIWKWLMNQGICITDYDVIDYRAWVAEGVAGFKKSIPADEFKWYQQNTYDLDAVTPHIEATFSHPNFTYFHKKPTWEDVVSECAKPGICDIVLNLTVLNNQDGFVAHRVVLIELTDDEVVFHDPNAAGTGAYRREPIQLFRRAFETIESPALARYNTLS